MEARIAQNRSSLSEEISGKSLLADKIKPAAKERERERIMDDCQKDHVAKFSYVPLKNKRKT